MKAAQGTGDDFVSAWSAYGAVTSVTSRIEAVTATRGLAAPINGRIRDLVPQEQFASSYAAAGRGISVALEPRGVTRGTHHNTEATHVR